MIITFYKFFLPSNNTKISWYYAFDNGDKVDVMLSLIKTINFVSQTPQFIYG